MDLTDEGLPIELLHSIFIFIHPKQSLFIQLTCKDWNYAFNHENLWKNFCDLYLPKEEQYLYKKYNSWKDVFISYSLFTFSSRYCSSNIKLSSCKKYAQSDSPLQPVIMEAPISKLNNTFIIKKFDGSSGYLGIGVIHKSILVDIDFNTKLPKKYIGMYNNIDFEVGFFDNGWFGSCEKTLKWTHEWYKGDSVKMEVLERSVKFTVDRDLENVYEIEHNEALDDLYVIVNVNGEVFISRSDENFGIEDIDRTDVKIDLESLRIKLNM